MLVHQPEEVAMYIPVNAIRIAQRRLGFPVDEVDGVLGPLTAAALDEALRTRRAELNPVHAGAILDGARSRKLTAFIQLLAADLQVNAGKIDGLWGPQTAFAFDCLAFAEEQGELPAPWRDVAPGGANPHHWPVEREAALVAFYGLPGDEANLVSVEVPYAHRLSWAPSEHVHRIRCHRSVADSLARVLGRVLEHYGAAGIDALRLDLWGGCYNHRRKRGGTAWSTHAWGIAMDYDPDRNRLNWGREHASFARPEYEAWWRCWEEEGWVSLGRSAHFDWMHVQAARRP
jgi:hypothetical protein